MQHRQQRLYARGLGARVELPMHGVYGRFRVDVAVCNAAGNILVVAEAKRRPHDLRIQQRTNYANCGCPALLAHRKNVEVVADAMWAYVCEDTYPPSALLITARTWASDRRHNGRIQRRELERKIVRG